MKKLIATATVIGAFRGGLPTLGATVGGGTR